MKVHRIRYKAFLSNALVGSSHAGDTKQEETLAPPQSYSQRKTNIRK